MKEKLWIALAVVVILSLGLAACGPTAPGYSNKEYVASDLILYESTGNRDTSDNLIYKIIGSTDSNWYKDGVGNLTGVDENGDTLTLIRVSNGKTGRSGCVKN